MTSPENWLRLDERSNALDNLRMCEHFLRALPDSIRWKWAIVALHQALYGFAIAAVQGTDASSVRKNPDDPNSHLISIWEALRRAKDPRYLRPGGIPLVTTPEEDKALNRLVSEFRNGFEHFAPAGWSIEVSGMHEILGRVLRLIEGVAIGTQSVRYWDDAEEQEARDAVARVAKALRPGSAAA
jgi:hypothetical protein